MSLSHIESSDGEVAKSEVKPWWLPFKDLSWPGFLQTSSCDSRVAAFRAVRQRTLLDPFPHQERAKDIYILWMNLEMRYTT